MVAHYRLRNYSVLVLGLILSLLMSACNAPMNLFGSGGDGGEGAFDPMNSSNPSSSDGNDQSGDNSLEPIIFGGRPYACIVPEKLIEDGLFSEITPHEDSALPGCPVEDIWHGNLNIQNTWRYDFDNGGYVVVSSEEPANVKLDIIPLGDATRADVIPSQDAIDRFPVTFSGKNTFNNQECEQQGSGHYLVDIHGTCVNGWVVLEKADLTFVPEGKATLKCDDDSTEVDIFVPDATPALTPCFQIAPGFGHSIEFNYSYQGGSLNTYMRLNVPDAEPQETVPLKLDD